MKLHGSRLACVKQHFEISHVLTNLFRQLRDSLHVCELHDLMSRLMQLVQLDFQTRERGIHSITRAKTRLMSCESGKF